MRIIKNFLILDSSLFLEPESKTYIYSISSTETYRKNNAILKAGNTKPTMGTKIAGKKDAAIYFF